MRANGGTALKGNTDTDNDDDAADDAAADDDDAAAADDDDAAAADDDDADAAVDDDDDNNDADAGADDAASVSYRAHTLENVSAQFVGNADDSEPSPSRELFVIHFIIR